MYVVIEDMGSMPTTHDLEVSYADSFEEAESLALDMSLENDTCYQIFEYTGSRICFSGHPMYNMDSELMDSYYGVRRGIDYPGTLL